MELPGGSGQQILVVDDDVNHVTLMKKRLEASGYKTLVAFDGIDGLNQAIHQLPDLIITDVLLPRMNGFKLVEELKANPQTSTIPVIMMSAVYVTEEDMARGFDLGAETYVPKADLALRKPLQEEALLEAAASLIRGAQGEEAPPARLLIVDDEPESVTLISKRLQSQGYQMDIARDGAEALDLGLKEAYDLVLLDIKLPKVDGLSVLSRLKEKRPETSVVMMTAFGSEKIAADALKRGADDYLIKPLEDAEPVQTVGQVLLRRRRQAEVERAAARLRETTSPDVEEKERLIDELRQSSIALMDQYDRLLAAEEQNRAYSERLEQMVDERTQNLQRRTRELAALHSVLSAATRSLDLPEVLIVVLGELDELLGTKSSAAFVIDPDTKRFRLVAQHRMPEEFLRDVTREPEAAGSFKQVLESGRGMIIHEPMEDERLATLGSDVPCMVAFPMKSSNEVVGLIVGVCDKSKEIDNNMWNLLDSIGEEMGVIVENAHLYENLRLAYLSTIRALAEAVDAKDSYTRGHSERVSAYAVAIARKLGLKDEFVDRIRDAGYLHDIGKIGTPDAVLTKRGILTSEEMATMRLHPGASQKILSPARLPEEIKLMIRHHHEHFDGTGYPDGLKGDGIPLGSRILAVADAYEAMTADRPYRQCLTIDEAIAELKRCTAVQFDPQIVEAFLTVRDNTEAVLKEAEQVT